MRDFLVNRGHVPDAQRRLRHLKCFAQRLQQRLGQCACLRIALQGAAPLVHLVGNGAVVLGLAHHFHGALLQRLDFFAQHFSLALLQAHGPVAMGAVELHAAQHFGVALKKLRRLQQELGNVFFRHRGHRRRPVR